MWHHILVPLDGTPGAEQALPLVAHIARGSGATLTLLRIQPPLPESAYLLDAALLVAKIKETERELAEAKHYLAHIITTDCLDGIGIRTKLLAGSPVETLLQFASEQHVDLIVMCRHDHHGLKRWLSSHTARHLVRQSAIPILALHENGSLTSLHEQNIPRHASFFLLHRQAGSSQRCGCHPVLTPSLLLASPSCDLPVME